MIRTHKQGSDVTLIANSYMLLEALLAAEELAKSGVSCEVLETVQTDKNGWQPIYNSVNKTGRVLICDSAHTSFSVGAELIASITENCFSNLKSSPQRMGLPDHPEPTSFGLTKGFYHSADNIVGLVSGILNVKVCSKTTEEKLHDIPGSWFIGPF